MRKKGPSRRVGLVKGMLAKNGVIELNDGVRQNKRGGRRKRGNSTRWIRKESQKRTKEGKMGSCGGGTIGKGNEIKKSQWRQGNQGVVQVEEKLPDFGQDRSSMIR